MLSLVSNAPFLRDILTILAASVIVWVIPALRGRQGRLAMALITACAVYRLAILNAVIWNAAGFLVLIGVDRSLAKRNRPRKLAWAYAQRFVLGLVLVFIAVRVAAPSGLRFHVSGMEFIWLDSPNMFLVLRLASLAWDR